MFNIEISALVISLDNKYEYTFLKCKDYLTNKENNTGIVLSVTDKRIQESIDYKFNFDGEVISKDVGEFDAIHYQLYEILHKYDAFWLHSVLISKDNVGYAFTASPGVGKSTHAKLWLEAFKDASIVNGDNTIVRLDKKDNIFYGYGTPFCGKEGYQVNQRVPLKAICFLERSETNYVEEIKGIECISSLMNDNWCVNRNKEAYADTMRLYVLLASQVKFYKIHCNMEQEAARVAYENISK